ncbi:hypothetical protein Daesc_004736 [Daldinia eschscholtzii]|uniref:S-adenosyl-L-methionine-dependent methyltransferase n=1 Tax=Daldinia eschscholtzii TaxID=292717 RepID=A0AAX6MQU3_9PEZI
MKLPRIPPSAIPRLQENRRHLAALLPTCKTLNSAQNELRWIHESLESSTLAPHFQKILTTNGNDKKAKHELLYRLCRLRGRGYPLQYILGNQPFGDLDIQCRPGVLIPRRETEAWTVHLAQVVRDALEEKEKETGKEVDADLKIIDMCTGSGCIALLLFSLLNQRFPRMQVRGYDIEPRAVELARKNLEYNKKYGLLHSPRDKDAIFFGEANVFSTTWPFHVIREDRCKPAEKNDIKKMTSSTQEDEPMVWNRNTFGVFVCNPPYISEEGFGRDTEHSVRSHEPRLALVPDPSASRKSYPDVRPEDIFYAQILDDAAMIQPQFVGLEVGDTAQAIRVVQMAFERYKIAGAEIWRDWPDAIPRDDEEESVEVADVSVPIRGSGNGRAVVLRRRSDLSPKS